MAEQTGIEWCDATFNIAWGCSKVSPGCHNCYAIGESKRRGFDVWGTARSGATRRVFGDAHWNEPLRWNRKAERDGVRLRVFCSSMADVCDDHPTTRAEVAKLWPLIEATPNLDWLLLTKRPENFPDILPATWLSEPPPNFWPGTSVESQPYANARVPHLLDVRAAVHFLSCEPLLAPVELTSIVEQVGPLSSVTYSALDACGRDQHNGQRIDWVIAGGESGPKARPARPDWIRSLRDQCVAAQAAFLFKQWGTWITESQAPDDITLPSVSHEPRRWKQPPGERYWRVSKHDAGRLLDGRTWDEFPAVRA